MNHRHSGFKWVSIVITTALMVMLVGCGTLTGIPSHGGGKRFAVEQQLVSTTIRGAIKQIDLSALRDKTVFIQLAAINDQGGGNIAGGRGALLFGLQGITESSPITSQTNRFDVFDLGSSSQATTSTAINGGSTTVTTLNGSTIIDSNSLINSNGTTGSTSNINSSSNGTSTDTATSNGTSTGTSTTNGTNSNTTNIGGSTNTSSSSSTTNIGGSTNTNSGTSTTNSSTTTSTGGTTTNQTGNSTTNNSSTTTVGGSTNTSTGSTTTNIGASTNTSSGTNSSTTNQSGTSSNTTNQSGTSSSTDTSNQVQSGTSANTTTDATNSNQTYSDTEVSNTRNYLDTRSSTSQSGNQETLSPEPTERKTQTKGTGYKGHYGFEYKGQGNYQNYNVAVSDVGILQSIIFSYFYLNGVNITVNPQSPNIDAIVYINVDVFGSIRSRLDTIVYNKETVKVQTVLEVMAIDLKDKRLIMPPQVGAYEALYDVKYVVWIGPVNKQKDRIKHREMENGQLVTFDDAVLHILDEPEH